MLGCDLKLVKDLIRKNHLSEKGQTAIEALMLLAVVFFVTSFIFEKMTPMIDSEIIEPLHSNTADTVRFGNFADHDTINEDDPQDEVINPYHRNRNEPLHL